ncbi:MAG: hypothetical protein JWQ88_3706 [Rhodoferax sp.]|nr:hypothetical protein [Rhodoferax sp.]
MASVWSFIILVLTVHLLNQREKAISAERDRLGTQARVIAENLDRQLRGANGALAGLRYELVTGDHHEPGLKTAPQRLKVLSDAMPGVRSMAVMNAEGTVVDADRKDLIGRNFKASQTFIVPAAELDTTRLYVSPPFKSPVSGVTISLGKVMLDDRGAFAGVVLASLDPEYFDTLMRSVFYAPDMDAAIVHGRGKVVVVVPPDAALLTTEAGGPGSAFARHLESGQPASLYEGTGGTARPLEQRMVASRTIQPDELNMNQPLVITISRLQSQVYAPWYGEVTATSLMAALTMAASVAILAASQRRRRALELMRASVLSLQAESARRFEFGLEGADLGLLDVDMDQGRLTVNSRQALMMGFEAHDTSHPAKTWQHRIHPEDWPLVRAHFAALLDGRAESFKIEHRMLRRDGHAIWVFSQTRVMARAADGRVTRVLGTHLDISGRKAAEAELHTTLKRFELAMKCGSVGLMDWDVTTDQLVLNAQARETLGLTDAVEMRMDGLKAMLHPDDARRAAGAFGQLLADPEFDYNLEFRARHARGRYIWLHARAEVVDRLPDGQPARVMMTYRDVSARVASELKLREVNEQLAQLSLTDALTGVANRRRFDQTLQAEWARCARSRSPIALLMIDIDYFKRYNDHYGHQGGDECLRLVASVLANCARRPDELLVRYGGEEFGVLMFGAELAEALKLAERCLEALRRAAIPHAASTLGSHVTLSIGVHSMVPGPGEAAAVLVRRADEALYAAKATGRARACPSPEAGGTSGTSATVGTGGTGGTGAGGLAERSGER